MSYNPLPQNVNPPSDPAPTLPYSPPAAPVSPLIPAGEPRLPGPAVANLVFFVGVLAFLTFSVIAQVGNWGFFLTSFSGELALALVAVFFCVMGRYNFKETFSLRKLDLWTVFLCLLLGFVGQFAVRFPTALNEWIMQIFGPFPVDELFPNPQDLPGRLLFFLAVVLIGPVCEETLNRGFVLAGYRHLSFWKCIFFVGLLFGLFHLYPFRFAYTFLLGMILAYLVLVTGSLWSAISAHIGFNLLGGLSPWILDILDKLAQDNGQSVVAGEGAIDLSALLATIPLSLVAGALFFLLLRAVTRRIAKRRPELELGYLGLARNIRSDLPPGPAAVGPFFGPDRRYNYGRYGYVRSETPANSPGFGLPVPNQAQAPVDRPPLPTEMPGPGRISSPYLTPQGIIPTYPPTPAGPGYSPNTGPGVAPAYAWDNPAPPRPRLSQRASLWWRLSFILIFLFYFYTTLTEISIRLNPAKTDVPKAPASQVQVQPKAESSLITLKYMV
jgi:membrane protease YdiL (CAAX protease family)